MEMVNNKREYTAAQWKEIKFKYTVKGKKVVKDVKAYKRLQALYFRGMGKTNKEIREITGFNVQYITDLVTKYMENGLDAILFDKRTSNNRRMSFEQEIVFLEQFEDLADAGQLVTAEKIQQEFEKTTGKSCDSSTIYKLLKRHGWRKVKPRPRHPDRPSDEELGSSKKLRSFSGSYWKNMTEKALSG